MYNDDVIVRKTEVIYYTYLLGGVVVRGPTREAQREAFAEHAQRRRRRRRPGVGGHRHRRRLLLLLLVAHGLRDARHAAGRPQSRLRSAHRHFAVMRPRPTVQNKSNKTNKQTKND